MDHENLEIKKRRILTRMALKEIETDIKDAKDFLLKGPAVDLKKVKEINAKLSGKIKNAEQDPGLETKRYLFAFKRKFHLIEAGQHRIIEDAEVRKQLDEHSDMKIFYLCTDESICPLPPALSGRDGKGVKLKNDSGVIKYIKELTGVELEQSDL